MPLPSQPAVEEKIRLAVELKAHHDDLAKTAQLSEEIIGSVEKLPVLKRACPFKRAFWENRPFFARFFCDFARFLMTLSTFNVNSPL